MYFSNIDFVTRQVPKIITAAEQDSAEAEYFEFAQKKAQPDKTKWAGWTGEFLNSAKNEPPTAYFEARLPQAAQIKKSSNSQWSHEFTAANQNVSWINEFASLDIQRSSINQADSWINEFTANNVDEDSGLRDTAAGILRNLENDHDPKLINSRFVAYLKEIAATSDHHQHQNKQQQQPIVATEFETWKSKYLQNVAPILDDNEWPQLQKSWEAYESTGYGYKDFASREFGTYHWSVPVGANIYHSIENKWQVLEEAERGKDIKTVILVLEAIVNEDPRNDQAWFKLGQAQQANEIDAQAIAAFLRTTTLNPKHADSWLGLAASCANESCVPDALDALYKLLACFPEYDPFLSKLQNATSKTFADVYSELITGNSPETLVIASYILQNLVGDYGKAIEILQAIPNHNVWCICSICPDLFRTGPSSIDSAQVWPIQSNMKKPCKYMSRSYRLDSNIHGSSTTKESL